MKIINLVLVFICSLFALSACTDDKLSREDEIRQFIKQGVEQAEKRSVSGVADMVNERYRDPKGLNKAQVKSMLRLYFLRHKNIYLFTKIDDILFHAENEATVKLHVAMAGSVISDVTALSSLRAQIYKFELQLVKEDEWRLLSAKWQRANISDIR